MSLERPRTQPQLWRAQPTQSMQDGGAKAIHFPMAPPARTHSCPHTAVLLLSCHIHRDTSSTVHLACCVQRVISTPSPSSCCVHRGIPSPPSCCAHCGVSMPSPPSCHVHGGPGLLPPGGRRFLHGSVSLCGVFGAGTLLTVLGESPTSSRSFLPHREIVTFCRFLGDLGFFSRTWRWAGVCRQFRDGH